MLLSKFSFVLYSIRIIYIMVTNITFACIVYICCYNIYITAKDKQADHNFEQNTKQQSPNPE